MIGFLKGMRSYEFIKKTAGVMIFSLKGFMLTPVS